MSDLKESAIILSLSEDYACNQISFDDYRKQRRAILLQLEKQLNQIDIDSEKTEHDVVV